MTLHEPGTETKECRFCKQTILSGASKCHHCDSFQNWRRHLALIVTLGAVFAGVSTALGFVAAPLTYALAPRVSLSFTPIGANGDEYLLLVQNKGRTPAVFRYAHAWFPAKAALSPNTDGNAYFDLVLDDTKVFVDARSTKVLKFIVDDERQHMTQPST